MKNKKLTYILLPAVIGIWGMIFYKIFSGLDNSDLPAADTAASSVLSSNAATADTFSLFANYRDPFLGSMEAVNDRPKITSPVTNTAPKITEPVKPAQLAWPLVSYSGMIKNQHSSVQLAMIQVNGQSYTVKAGETVEGIQVMKVYRDSIEVKFQTEKKIFRK